MGSQTLDRNGPASLASFGVIWFGQAVSLLGSGLTSFAVGIWVYQTTREVTSYATIALAAVVPALLLMPISGALVDRWNYRIVMLASDGASALITLLIGGLFFLGKLELWHIYVGVAANACFASFQQPAYYALVSKLVPSEQLGRAAGMLQMGIAASDVFAPLLAGVLIVQIGLAGVVLIDFSTFLFAAVTLMLVRIVYDSNTTTPPNDGEWNTISLLRETWSGWKYVSSRPGLLGLLAYLGVAGFASGVINSILVPMLLTLTSPARLGLIISIAGGGMFAGGLAMSLWGGPNRRIRGVFASELVKGLGIILIGLRPDILLIALGATIAHFAIPMSAAINQAIWQVKIPQDMQGRVFAVRQLVTRSMMPLAYLLAGPLADHVFEPLMRSPHGLRGPLGLIMGTGPGRGMGVLFSLMGLVIIVAAVAGMATPAIRNVEDA